MEFIKVTVKDNSYPKTVQYNVLLKKSDILSVFDMGERGCGILLDKGHSPVDRDKAIYVLQSFSLVSELLGA